jgi:hypothetical protein
MSETVWLAVTPGLRIDEGALSFVTFIVLHYYPYEREWGGRMTDYPRLSWPAQHEGDPDVVLIRVAFVTGQAVLPQLKPVVCATEARFTRPL